MTSTLRPTWWLTPLLLLLLVFSAPAATAEKKLKLATLAPKGSTYHKTLMRMREAWRQAGIKLTIYPDGVMGGEAAMVRRIRVGQIHVSLMTASGLAEIDPSVSALQNMPMVFNDLKEVEYVRSELLGMIEKKFAAKGFILLSLNDAGWVRFFSTRAAVRPDDFKSLKIFALSTDVHTAEIWKAAGYNAVSLDTTDMLPGLKTGLVDVVPAPPEFALAGQFYTPAPHMLDLNWAPLIGGIVISRRIWDRLPEDKQAVLKKAAVAAGVEIRDQSRTENSKAIDAMKKRGLTVHEVTPAIVGEWRAQVEQAYPMIRGKIVPADLFDKVRALLADYRKKKQK